MKPTSRVLAAGVLGVLAAACGPTATEPDPYGPSTCGAQVSWSGCNPLSTNDEVAAALAKAGIEIYAWYGQDVDDFYWSIERTRRPTGCSRCACAPTEVS